MIRLPSLTEHQKLVSALTLTLTHPHLQNYVFPAQMLDQAALTLSRVLLHADAYKTSFTTQRQTNVYAQPNLHFQQLIIHALLLLLKLLKVASVQTNIWSTSLQLIVVSARLDML